MSAVNFKRESGGLHRLLAVSVALVIAGVAGTAAAQPVLITAPQTVGPLQTEITPTAGGAPVPLATAQLTVRGTTLTINGRHQIASLVVEPNGPTAGVVTHSNAFTFDYAGDGSDVVNGLYLIVGGDVVVQAAASIDLSLRGYPRGTGPSTGSHSGQFTAGGAGHGGRGGNGSQSGAIGGGIYGSIDKPSQFGSGNWGCAGGVGGGAIHLQIQGNLLISGTIRAVGGNGSGGCNNWVQGGGAGGSILIYASAISGTGLVIANGGNGGRSDQGGGGGGRIAVYTCDQQLPLSNFTVNGGSGFQAGQPGTIFFGSGTISITEQPVAVSLLPGEGFALQAAANTSQPDEQLTYQWRKKDETGAFVPLVEGQGGGRYNGVDTPMLMVSNSTCTDSGEYDCLVQDSCGSFPTRSVMVAVVQTGDIADDFGLTINEGGGPDGVVDFGDFAALLGLIGSCPGSVPGCLGDIADDFGLTADEGGGPDGVVDFGDFAALLGLIGPCP